MPSKIIVARHGLRLDSINKQWLYTSPTPYDSPLAAPKGFQDASNCGWRILQELGKAPARIYIHSSPFLRCVQTANEIAKVLGTITNVTIRLDAVFGEWLTEDYYNDISPPPSDGHQSISESSLAWLRAVHSNMRSMSVGTYQQSLQSSSELQKPAITIDSRWDIHELGSSGDYGEEWAMMHERVCTGFRNLLDYYEDVEGDFMVAVITHGAVCNSLLGFLSDQPLLQKVELSAFAIAERQSGIDEKAKGNSWKITFNSSKGSSNTPSSSSDHSHLSRQQRKGSNVAFPAVVTSYRESSPNTSPFIDSPVLGGLTPPRSTPNNLIPQGRTPPALSPTNSFKSIKNPNSTPDPDAHFSKELATGGQPLPFALSSSAKQSYERSVHTTPPSASSPLPTDHFTMHNTSSNTSSATASPSFRFVSNFGRSQASPLSLSPSTSPPKQGISLQRTLSGLNNSSSKTEVSDSPGNFMLNFGS